MWESIILSLAATAGNNIGKVLQKKGTVILPPLSFKLKVIRAYAVGGRKWVDGRLKDSYPVEVAVVLECVEVVGPLQLEQSTAE